jgi:hypothetical protein
MDAETIRQGLLKILTLAEFLAKFTSTTVDDKVVAFLKVLAATPGLIEAILDLLKTRGIKLE